MIVAEVVGVKRIPLLGKGGVDAPSRNIPVPLKGADGVVRSDSKTILLNEPPRLRPLRDGAKIISQIGFDGVVPFGQDVMGLKSKRTQLFSSGFKSGEVVTTV